MVPIADKMCKTWLWRLGHVRTLGVPMQREDGMEEVGSKRGHIERYFHG